MATTKVRAHTQYHLEEMPEKSYYLPGLQKGWELARQKKLPPKPCLVCGKDVYYKSSTKDRAKYCSVECRNKGLTGRKQIVRKLKSGVVYTCKVCQKEFYRTPSEIAKGKSNYCSLACRKEGNYNPYRKGENAPTWKGGRCKVSGYVYLYASEHPRANCQHYVAEHRLVMEKYLNRYLLPAEQVHHKNGVRDDNRLENLQLVSPAEHSILNTICSSCSLRKEIRLLRWEIKELRGAIQARLEGV